MNASNLDRLEELAEKLPNLYAATGMILDQQLEPLINAIDRIRVPYQSNESFYFTKTQREVEIPNSEGEFEPFRLDCSYHLAVMRTSWGSDFDLYCMKNYGYSIPEYQREFASFDERKHVDDKAVFFNSLPIEVRAALLDESKDDGTTYIDRFIQEYVEHVETQKATLLK